MARNQEPNNSETARRLQRLRYLVALDSQSKFAAAIGIDVKRWNNFERGSPLSKDVAFILVKKFPGLTLDWLFLGNEDGLSVKLQRDLHEAGKAMTAKGRS